MLAIVRLSMKTKDIVDHYYSAWATRDKGKAFEMLHTTDFSFRSPEDIFHQRKEFVDRCWHYGEGLIKVEFLYEVYDDQSAFVILEWSYEQGGTFVGAEYLTVNDGKITSILIINNSHDFWNILHRDKNMTD